MVKASLLEKVTFILRLNHEKKPVMGEPDENILGRENSKYKDPRQGRDQLDLGTESWMCGQKVVRTTVGNEGVTR